MQTKHQSSVSHRLGLNYFLFFLIPGLFLPWLPVFLKMKGFSPSEIGYLSSISSLCILIFPTLAGFMLKPGKLKRVYFLSLVISLAGLLLLFGDWQFFGMAVVLLIFFGARSLGNPLLDSLSLSLITQEKLDYAKVRLFGSLGFILATLGGAYLFAGTGTPFLIVSVICLLVSLPASLMLPEEARILEDAPQPRMADLMQARVGLLFLGIFCMNFSHGPYFSYFSIYMQEECGLSSQQISWYWASAVFAEIIIMGFYLRIFGSKKPHLVLALSLALGSLRWILMGLWPHPVLILILQALHAFTFGTFHLSVLQMIREEVAPQSQTMAINLYASLGFGLSIMAGSQAGAMIVEQTGMGQMFVLSGIVPGVAAILIFLFYTRFRSQITEAA